MADNEITSPAAIASQNDEVAKVEKVADSNTSSTTTTTDSTDSNDSQPKVALRNMIVVPANCPDGYQMGADGVCREVF